MQLLIYCYDITVAAPPHITDQIKMDKKERTIPLKTHVKPRSLMEVLKNRGWLNLRETAAYIGQTKYKTKTMLTKHRLDFVFCNGVYRVWPESITELERLFEAGINFMDPDPDPDLTIMPEEEEYSWIEK